MCTALISLVVGATTDITICTSAFLGTAIANFNDTAHVTSIGDEAFYNVPINGPMVIDAATT